jgi:hypothetical protein
MRRSFRLPTPSSLTTISGPRLWLLVAVGALALLNLIALFFVVAPPGGTRRELRAQSDDLRHQIASASVSATRVERVAAKVQSGGTEAIDFAGTYFLPKRKAYDAVLSEGQRMARQSGVQAREAVFNEEPVEGSDDLSVMNVTANFEGTYDTLMQFLFQVDRSPMLLMLDTLQAAPQQHGAQVNASIRFQAIVRDDAIALAGGQQ